MYENSAAPRQPLIHPARHHCGRAGVGHAYCLITGCMLHTVVAILSHFPLMSKMAKAHVVQYFSCWTEVGVVGLHWCPLIYHSMNRHVAVQQMGMFNGFVFSSLVGNLVDICGSCSHIRH